MRKPRPHSETLTDLTRDAIQSSPLTPAELAERTGIHRGTLYRFLSGKQSLTLATFDRLNDVLRLRITRR